MADDKIVMDLGRVIELADVQWSQPCDPTAWDTQALHDDAAGSHYGALFMTGGTRATSATAVMAKAFGSYPAGVAPGLPAGDVRPPPDAPIDRVLGDLAADAIGKADRRRLGDALDAANQRAEGTRAKPDEAFGRILRGDGAARLGIVTP